MNGAISDNESFLNDFLKLLEKLDLGGLICGIAVPSVYLFQFSSRLVDNPFLLGSQDVSAMEGYGPFTGEISAKMLAEFDCSFSIIGHSERREKFLESNEVIAKKATQLLKYGITPVVCVGENSVLRKSGEADSFVAGQINELSSFLSKELLVKCQFAYEPIWAIGTGKIALTSDVREMHNTIRRSLVKNIGEDSGLQIPILYGGSVNADNVLGIMSEECVDGVLVGGASIRMDSFGDLLDKAVNRLH
jgi:triosephosphate isomerase